MLKRFQVVEGAPEKFVAFAVGYGVHEFSTQHLTDEEAEALFNARCPYIKEVKAMTEKPNGSKPV
ncbi:hypothetical protein [Chitinophaga rhizosphaerae]|uniref:hypothetical protein n=1 Tax=Chitinophaga rhizosphaerae TaxID=1864947 RepID=UPI000F810DA2|nr:hypothetical protein [Chitinophaga rhizosphaerae]